MERIKAIGIAIAEDAAKFRISNLMYLIRYNWFRHRIKVSKHKDLWSGYMDKKFYETVFKTELEYDDTDDRIALNDEKKKPQEKQNTVTIIELEDRITRAKAIKNNYAKNSAFIDEIGKYIDSLD